MSKKTVYRVAELPHVFANITRDNATAADGFRAGELAKVAGAVLYHGRAAAMARVTDATAPDGTPVYMIAPQYQDADARWSPHTLRAAVPEQEKPGRVVVLEQWPHAMAPGRYVAFFGPSNGAGLESAAYVFERYLASFEAAGMRSVRSEIDPEGENPCEWLRHYSAALRDVLALKWADPIAQHDARKAWAAMRDRWGASADGGTDLAVVRAIATREHLSRKAAASVGTLRDYFTVRATVRTVRDRAAMLDRFPERELSAAVAAVLRAGVPADCAALFGANPAATIVEDRQRAARLDRWQNAQNRLAEGGRIARQQTAAFWRGAITWREVRRYNDETGRQLGAVTPSQKAAAAELSRVVNQTADRAAARHFAAEAARLVAFAGERNAAALAALDALAAYSDPCDDDESVPVAEWWGAVHEAVDTAREARDILPRVKNPRQRATLAAFTGSWPLDYQPGRGPASSPLFEKFRAAETNKANWCNRNAEKMEAAGIRKDWTDILERAERMPRLALRQLEAGGRWNFCRPNYWSYYGPVKDDALRDALRAEFATVRESVRAKIDAISAADEFRAGGDPPGAGDWCRVKGGRVTTTRSAQVTVRDVCRAFRLLDALPAGPAELADRRFMLGPYQLLRRTDNGTVVVGCHYFSAEAVAMLRADLAAADDAGDAGDAGDANDNGAAGIA